MESRIKYLEEEVNKLQLDKFSLELLTRNMREELTNLFDKFCHKI